MTWRNSSGRLLCERGRFGGVDNPDSRASLLGQATLVLKNTELYDNGTYIAQLTAKTGVPVLQTFTVFIKGKYMISIIPKNYKNNLHQFFAR